MSTFIGEIQLFPFNFVPRNFLPCDGRQVSISQYSELFETIGTTYGGDGVVNFAVPDLRGRAAVGVGVGAGLSPISLGEQVGAASVTLSASQLPVHHHGVAVDLVVQIPANAGPGTSITPGTNQVLSMPSDTKVGAEVALYGPGPGNTSLMPFASALGGTTNMAGNGQAVDIRNPALGLTYCIAYLPVY